VRIVVTGASGNVGSALLRRLCSSSEHELVGVARRPPDGGAPFDRTGWVSADLSEATSAEVLDAAFRGADAVVHLAWGFQPSHRTDYLEELGVGGTRRVLDAAAAADVPHVVHMSSVGAYSPKADDTPVDESWPTGGVPSSWYSRAKSAAERLLDDFEADRPGSTVTRLRPGIIGQGSAGSSLLRYAVPALVPARALGWVPVVPLDRRLAIPMVHADDVADAIEKVLVGRVAGPFNLAAPPPITRDDIATVLKARPVHVPAPVVRAAVSLSWHARLQQVDPGWLDMGFALPLLDCGRAHRELGWSPTKDALSVLEETVAGVRHGWSDGSPVLRARTVAGELTRVLRGGPVGHRRQP
jgi:UDP-glucose 4-epimerase